MHKLINVRTAKIVIAVAIGLCLMPISKGQDAFKRKGEVYIGTSLRPKARFGRTQFPDRRHWTIGTVIQPRLGIFVTDDLLLSIQGEVEIVRSTAEILNGEYYGIGPSARYYLPFTQGLFRSNNNTRATRRSPIIGYVEVNSYWKNGAEGPDVMFTLPRLSIFEIQTGAGLDFFVNENLAIELGCMIISRPAPQYPIWNPIRLRLGIDYFIQSGKESLNHKP